MSEGDRSDPPEFQVSEQLRKEMSSTNEYVETLRALTENERLELRSRYLNISVDEVRKSDDEARRLAEEDRRRARAEHAEQSAKHLADTEEWEKERAALVEAERLVSEAEPAWDEAAWSRKVKEMNAADLAWQRDQLNKSIPLPLKVLYLLVATGAVWLLIFGALTLFDS